VRQAAFGLVQLLLEGVNQATLDWIVGGEGCRGGLPDAPNGHQEMLVAFHDPRQLVDYSGEGGQIGWLSRVKRLLEVTPLPFKQPSESHDIPAVPLFQRSEVQSRLGEALGQGPRDFLHLSVDRADKVGLSRSNPTACRRSCKRILKIGMTPPASDGSASEANDRSADTGHQHHHDDRNEEHGVGDLRSAILFSLRMRQPPT